MAPATTMLPDARAPAGHPRIECMHPGWLIYLASHTRSWFYALGIHSESLCIRLRRNQRGWRIQQIVFVVLQPGLLIDQVATPNRDRQRACWKNVRGKGWCRVRPGGWVFSDAWARTNRRLVSTQSTTFLVNTCCIRWKCVEVIQLHMCVYAFHVHTAPSLVRPVCNSLGAMGNWLKL